MKIRLRAAIEVVVGSIGLILAIVLFNAGVDYILENYGIKGFLLSVAAFVMLLFMNLAYQIRVSQLKYQDTLNMKVD